MLVTVSPFKANTGWHADGLAGGGGILTLIINENHSQSSVIYVKKIRAKKRFIAFCRETHP
jgi:hypothetical protein